MVSLLDRFQRLLHPQNASLSGLRSISLTFLVEVFMLFKVFFLARVQQLTFLLVVAWETLAVASSDVQVFSQFLVHQRLRSRMWIARLPLSVPVAHGVRVSRTSTFQCLACDHILVELMLMDGSVAGSSLSLAPEVAVKAAKKELRERRQDMADELLCSSRHVPFRRRQAQDAPHPGRYGPEGQLRSIYW